MELRCQNMFELSYIISESAKYKRQYVVFCLSTENCVTRVDDPLHTFQSIRHGTPQVHVVISFFSRVPSPALSLLFPQSV